MYVHTRSNMHAVSVCFHNPPNYDTTTYRVFNVLHNLLMTVYTQVFASIYSVRMNGCLFYGGGKGLGSLFSYRGALWTPSMKFLKQHCAGMLQLKSPLPLASPGPRQKQTKKLSLQFSSTNSPRGFSPFGYVICS